MTSISILLYIFLGIACHGMGRWISSALRLRFRSRLEFFTISTGIGLIALAIIGFILGLFGFLNQRTVFPILFIIFINTIISFRKPYRYFEETTGRNPSGNTKLFGYATVGYLLILTFIAFVGALAPDTVWDAHSYHLDLPKRWISSGSMGPIPYHLYSNWPLDLSTIYAIEMVIQDGTTLPQLTHYGLGVLSTLLIFNFTRNKFGSPAAYFSSTIFYSISAISWVSTTAISDLGVTFFTLFALVSYFKGTEQDEYRWFILAGIGLGAAMGTKNVGVFSIIAFVPVAGLYIISNRHVSGIRLNGVIIVSTIAIIMVLPWYIRSYINTGDPLYPFGFSLFEGRYWTEAIDERFLAQQYNFWGAQRRIIDYMILPFKLIVPNHFPHGGWISWIFLPVFIWGIWQWKAKQKVFLSLFALIYFLLWARFSSRQVRLLLPALAALSILTGPWIISVSSWLREKKPLIEKFRYDEGNNQIAIRFQRLILILFFTIVISEGLFTVWSERSYTFPDQLRLVAGRIGKEEYMAKWFYLSDVMRFMNEELPPDGAVLAFNEVRGYLSNREFIWGSPSLQGFIDYDQLTTKSALLNRMEELSVQYILINNTQYPTDAKELDPIKDEMELIYERGKVYLYSLEISN